ncbi:MAG: TOBE domain-containing protein, partial [Bilifractor sp.]|nr:TOBE domain-containing protein [Bilifractor sp.]
RVRFGGGEFDCVDDVAEGTHITAVVRPEDIEITAPEKGIVQGTVTNVIFKGIHYEITVTAGKYEYEIQSTKNASVGSRVGLFVEPDGIHVMIAEDHTNVFYADINRDFRLEYNGQKIETSVTKIITGSRRLEDGSLVDAQGDVIDLNRTRIRVEIQPEDIEMTDEQDAGLVQGNISNLIYQGDHYSYVIQTDLEQDFVVYDEDLWNMGDRVSLIMPLDKMKFVYDRKK